MKRFLIRTVIYGVLLLVLCFVMQYVADTGLRKSESNDHKNWSQILEGKINAEVIVAGSSRAMRMIDPKAIEDKTRLSCYNLGMEGARLQSQLTRWDTYLANNEKPRLIIQTVDLMSMGHANTVFKKQQFLPFLSEPIIYNHLLPVDKTLYLDRYFPLYKYHGYIDEFKEGVSLFMGRKSSASYTEYKGFESKDKAFNNEFKEMKEGMKTKYLIHPPELVKEGYAILDKMIKDCQEKDIQLVLLFTPQYQGLTDLQSQTDSLVMGFEKLAEKENVHFMNYVYDDMCKDEKYFYNAMHLNKTGADTFTRRLVDDLYQERLMPKPIKKDQ